MIFWTFDFYMPLDGGYWIWMNFNCWRELNFGSNKSYFYCIGIPDTMQQMFEIIIMEFYSCRKSIFRGNAAGQKQSEIAWKG